MLDTVNFLVADVRGAVGPFLNVFLVSQQHWSLSEVGLVTTMGGLLGIAVQTRIGTAIDETRAKRGAIVLSLDVLACSAMVLFILPRFWPATGGVRRIRNTTNQKSGIESRKNRVPTETSMASYALWNNKGGVGKSYLTFQIACEYAITHPNKNVLVLDLCPQANSSIMLLGGMDGGETHLDEIAKVAPKRTIAGYIEDRLRSPYVSPRTGATYLTRPAAINKFVPQNVFLVAGDEDLEIQSSRVSNATRPGPPDAWRIVHQWVADLVADIKVSWGDIETTVFIDCNPSFTIYTELALSAADRLIIPFSADGSSKRAVRAVLALLYGINRNPGGQRSEFSINSETYRQKVPEIYCYVGNRLTQANSSSAKAFRSVVTAIGDEIWNVWRSQPSFFCIHPTGVGAPSGRRDFKNMFQSEINDANTASVVSGALGIPMSRLTAGNKTMPDGRASYVNDTQLQKQQPNLKAFVSTIE